MGQGVPQVDVLVVPSRDELVLGGVSGEGPHLVHVAGDDLLEIEVERALEDRVPGRAQDQLAAFALKRIKRKLFQIFQIFQYFKRFRFSAKVHHLLSGLIAKHSKALIRRGKMERKQSGTKKDHGTEQGRSRALAAPPRQDAGHQNKAPRATALAANSPSRQEGWKEYEEPEPSGCIFAQCCCCFPCCKR